MPNSWRVTHYKDVVPQLPPQSPIIGTYPIPLIFFSIIGAFLGNLPLVTLNSLGRSTGKLEGRRAWAIDECVCRKYYSSIRQGHSWLSMRPINETYHWDLSLRPITGTYRRNLSQKPIAGTYHSYSNWIITLLPTIVKSKILRWRGTWT